MMRQCRQRRSCSSGCFIRRPRPALFRSETHVLPNMESTMNSLLKLIVAGTAMPAILFVATETASAQMAMPDACKSASSMSGDMKMPGGMQTGEMADHQKAMMESMQKMYRRRVEGQRQHRGRAANIRQAVDGARRVRRGTFHRGRPQPRCPRARDADERGRRDNGRAARQKEGGSSGPDEDACRARLPHDAADLHLLPRPVSSDGRVAAVVTELAPESRGSISERHVRCATPRPLQATRSGTARTGSRRSRPACRPTYGPPATTRDPPGRIRLEPPASCRPRPRLRQRAPWLFHPTCRWKLCQAWTAPTTCPLSSALPSFSLSRANSWRIPPPCRDRSALHRRQNR